MARTHVTSWGNISAPHHVEHIRWHGQTLSGKAPFLPYGQGRSYGDVALNSNGTLLKTDYLNKFIDFNKDTGLLTCEAGVTIADILQLTVPHGWFMPVTPGTKFVSVGGAIANDVHGKNHHRAGTFGCNVSKLTLLRSSGEYFTCSPEENTELFQATIGGLGLTGLITTATIQLKKITSPFIDVETFKTKSLDEFFTLSQQSDKTHEYTVTWIDTTATGKQLGRGLFMRGNHSNTTKAGPAYKKPVATMPVYMPDWFINVPLIKAFNIAYYHKQLASHTKKTVHYDPYFYPLDVLQNWNKLYGQRGFQSFQCVVPHEKAESAIEETLHAIHKHKLSSPLTIFKLFGDMKSPGMLSFPMPGMNMLFDFPNTKNLPALLQELDEITLKYNGKINPAKDAHMSAKTFQTMYPNWQQFSQHIDPNFSSDFWKRVTA